MIDELKEVFELATSATVFIKEIMKLKPNNKNSDKDELVLSNKGNSARIGSSGNSARIGSSGNYAQIGSSGNSAQIGSSGYSARIGSSGNYARIGSSGDYAQIDSTGSNSVVAGIGLKSIAKATKGSWITLAEYKPDDEGNCIVDFVKTEQVDGKTIKENTYYTLYNHQFVEVQIIDDIETIILQRKKNVMKGLFLGSLIPCYVVEKDGVYAHGATLKEAKESLIYKITDRNKSDYEDYTLDTEVTHEEAIKMYRVITGACEMGTRNFVENVLTKKKKKYTVREVIKLTKGQYGNETLKEFMENK
nr:MAG TPA: hypothetical protein [Caudoviricetes sp.]